MGVVRIPPIIQEELEDIDWRLEPGARHYKLYIGKRLVGVLSHGKATKSETDRRSALNLRAQIRRAKKEAKKDGTSL